MSFNGFFYPLRFNSDVTLRCACAAVLQKALHKGNVIAVVSVNLCCVPFAETVGADTLICPYCGKAIPNELISFEKQKEIDENLRSNESLQTNHEFNVRSLGLALMGIGGACDLISMTMISSLDVSAFSTVLAIGSVCFGLGLLLTFAFRV